MGWGGVGWGGVGWGGVGWGGVGWGRADLIQLHPFAFHPLWSDKAWNITARAHGTAQGNNSSNATRCRQGNSSSTHRSAVVRGRPRPPRHHRFHLSNSAGAQREILDSSVCDGHDIFEAHPTEPSEALQHWYIEEVLGAGVGQSGLQQSVHEVAAWLHGEHHARLQRARGAELLDALRCSETRGGSCRKQTVDKCESKWKEKTVV